MFKIKPIILPLLLPTLLVHTAFAAKKLSAEQDWSSNLITSYEEKRDISPPLILIGIKDKLIKEYPSFKNKADLKRLVFLPAAESSYAPLLRLTTFQGLGVGFGNYQVTEVEPNPNITVGLTQVMQYANPDILVFDKTTGQVVPGFPKNANSLWAGFGGPCEMAATGRITMKHDQLADRWVITQYANQASGTDFFHCIAVSTSGDAAGTYYRYAYKFDSFSDFTRFAMWRDAYYGAFNMIGRISNGPRMCAFERDKMLAGTPARMICKQLESTESKALIAGNLVGSDLPLANSPEYFISLLPPANLKIFKFKVNFDIPQNTVISSIDIPVQPFVEACRASNGQSCAIQPNTSNLLNLVSDRIMLRMVYRKFPTYGAMISVHVIEGPQPKFAPAIRWYELRIYDDTTSFNPIVYQTGNIAPDSKNRFNPSASMDKNGSIAIGYTVTSSLIYPSLELSWRDSSDPLGQTSIQPLVTGRGSQINGVHNWGSSSKMVGDPSDNCHFWYTNEYLKANGSQNWSTAIVKFKIPSCQ